MFVCVRLAEIKKRAEQKIKKKLEPGVTRSDRGKKHFPTYTTSCRKLFIGAILDNRRN